MLALHMCSGRPVVADCCWAKSSGVCVPSPSGSVAFRYRSAGLLHASRSGRRMGIARSTSRACWAWRMSRSTRPPLAWLTLAIGSPVAKWTTLSDFERLVRLAPAEDGNVEHGGSPDSVAAASVEMRHVHSQLRARQYTPDRRRFGQSRGTAARR